MENFSFPVDDILLQIESNVFSYAEVFHGIGHNCTQLIANPEKMINTRFTGKYHCSKVENIDFLLSKIF
jgi:hypothetical protein